MFDTFNGMLIGLLIVLVILWFLGYIHISSIPIPNMVLLTINNQPVTLWDLLIFLVIAVIIGVLPGPFRAIASVLLILWILSLFGILAIGGLSSLIVIAVIVGLLFYLLGGFA